MLDQQALNLSMVGRKMVPVHRLKNAIINKETEGKFKVNGQPFLSSTPLLFLKDMTSRPPQIFFGITPQTPRWSLGQIVTGHQFSANSDVV